MQVTKVRIADDSGLVPAGLFFQKLASGLRDANAQTAAQLEREEARERRLEERCRRASAGRNVYAPRVEYHATM